MAEKKTIMLNINDFFKESVAIIYKGIFFNEALFNLAKYLRKVLPIKEIRISTYNPGHRKLHLIIRADCTNGEYLNTEKLTTPDIHNQIIEESSMQQLEVINDPDSDKKATEMNGILSDNDSNKSLLIVKRWIDSETIGIVVLSASGKGRYSNNHKKLFLLLEDVIFNALGNFIAYNRAVQQNKILQDKVSQLTAEKDKLVKSPPVVESNRYQETSTDTDLDTIIASHIRSILKRTNGKVHGQDGAAKLLGVHPSTLRSKMKKLHIAYGKSYPDSNVNSKPKGESCN